MVTRFDNSVKEEVWRTLRALNDAWTKGDGTGLENYFHQDMVAITPQTRERVEGGEACVAGRQAFARAAKIHYFREIDPKIQVFRDAAVVTYYYDMSFDSNGQAIHAAGRDMFVFVRENGRWWAVADHFSPGPQ